MIQNPSILDWFLGPPAFLLGCSALLIGSCLASTFPAVLLCLALFLVSAALLLGSPTEISCCSAAAFLLRLPGSPPLLLGSPAVLLGSPAVLLSRLLCFWVLLAGLFTRRKVVHETCVNNPKFYDFWSF